MTTVVFSISHSLFSKVIRKVTKSEVSHVAIVVNNKYVIEANPFDGVRAINYRDFLEIQEVIYCFQVQDPENAIAQNIYDIYGSKRYGFKDLFYVLLKNLFKLRWHKLLDEDLICSEVVALYLEMLHPDTFKIGATPPTPEELLEWCNKNLK